MSAVKDDDAWDIFEEDYPPPMTHSTHQNSNTDKLGKKFATSSTSENTESNISEETNAKKPRKSPSQAKNVSLFPSTSRVKKEEKVLDTVSADVPASSISKKRARTKSDTNIESSCLQEESDVKLKQLKENERLRQLGFHLKLYSDNKTISKSDVMDELPRSLLACNNVDIVKKGISRKNEYLFIFPGKFQLPSPENATSSSGAMVGTLDQLNTENPVCYLDFPDGRIKLLGALAHTRDQLIALQCSSSEVLVENVFDKVVIFSDYMWIGKKDENPNEDPLPLPESLAKRVL